MIPSLMRILVADDEPSIVSYLKDILTEEGYQVVTASGGAEAGEKAEGEQVHLALVDLVMQDMSGLEVLKRIRERAPSTRVIIMTAFGTVETAVEAMKQGALDYLIKPFSNDEIKLQVRRALSEVSVTRENRALKREVARHSSNEDMIGTSPAIREVKDLIQRVADSNTTVLILGETGSGKELVARALHRQSSRHAGPFLAINCSALPEALLEREFFGHERGAFTGADAMRPGLLEAAEDGTLLFDEIAEMPQPLQAKFLRVLEGHEFLRIGGTRPIKSRVRFIASTNQDLGKAVAEKRFREDLYYRLNVVAIKLPALRQRGEDILALAEHFLRLFGSEKGRRIEGFSPDAKKALLQYSWPGNVRELKNVIERSVILCLGRHVEPSDFQLEPALTGSGSALGTCMSLPYQEAKKSFERTYLTNMLKSCGGNISQAASRMGLYRQNLQTKLKSLGIKTPK